MTITTAPSSARDTAKFDESGDSDDLQALFDSIATTPAASATLAPAPAPVKDDTGDCDELQALFDSVADQNAPPLSPSPASTTAAHESSNLQIFNRIGQMTRELHDTMRELGYDRALEEAARAIPDARQRLSYIAQMTEQAASRVLNATDIARPIQDGLGSRAATLSNRWNQVFANQLSAEDFKQLAADTQTYLQDVPNQVQATNAQLTEIMMAQDFQDLTGQVIKKVVELAQRMEQQLLAVLLESMPPEVRAETPEGLLNGPVINATGRTDVVSNQAQVDDLLDSLGF